MLELIINQKDNIESIVLVENGKIVETYTSTNEDMKRRIEGNIYCGKVGDIIDGMQAAFVDFGGERRGFIHAKDVIPQIDETKEKKDVIDIKKVLKSNQKLLIQIKKDSDEKKGARVSTHISLPGKYIVLMPNTTFITVSQKIENLNQKEELKKYIKSILPNGFGAIIRTSAFQVDNSEIKEDIESLLKKWQEIQKKYKETKNKPTLIWESENIAQKMITDLQTKNLQMITTNNEKEYNKLKEYIPKDSKIKIELDKKSDLLSKYDINIQLKKIENRKIWLNCGGFITIDKTEALTAIDVNTGKFTGKKDLETTIFKVNKEATIEIAKQLRLRDIGGIIIIDYIDMQLEENKQKIKDILKEELKNDRAKTQVEGFTKLNLMELTRKHICSHLNA